LSSAVELAPMELAVLGLVPESTNFGKESGSPVPVVASG